MAVDIKEMREREKKNVLNLRPDEIGISKESVAICYMGMW